MRIVALVGRNGSGKSYRAIDIARQYHIEYIIDDGALIKIENERNVKIAGICIKESPNTIRRKIRSVLPIVLFEQSYSKEVKEAIINFDIQAMLIISTSKKMIDRIVNNLEINKDYNLIHIEEISTKEDICNAVQARRSGGRVNLTEHNTKTALSLFEKLEKKDNKEKYEIFNNKEKIEFKF